MKQLNTIGKLVTWLESKKGKSFQPILVGKWKAVSANSVAVPIEDPEDSDGVTADRQKTIHDMEKAPDMWSDVSPSTKFQKVKIVLQQSIKLGLKSVIYSPWVHPLHLLAGYLHHEFKDKSIYWLTGEQTTSNAKEEALSQFKNSKDASAILLAVPWSGGIGINIVEASVCMFLSLSWNPQQDWQCLCRCWRKGMHANTLSTHHFYSHRTSTTCQRFLVCTRQRCGASHTNLAL